MATGSVEDLPRPIGYVLGGGGSLGAIQVGMLQALSERDLRPDLVAGTSVGSINGAVLASDPTGAAHRLSHAWARMTRDRVFPGGLIAQALMLQRVKTHLFPNTGLAEVIAEFLGSSTDFSDLALPFAAVTMDVATAAPHVLRSGPLLPALLASAAIPGIYPPVNHDGLRLYDGGVVANVPMRQAVAMGARSLIVLDCFFPGQLPASTDTIADIVLYTALVTMRSQAVAEATLVANELPVVYLPGPSPKLVSPLDFSHTTALIEDAYTYARRFLDNLRIGDGPGLYGQRPPEADVLT
ncbi:patatin-like phospholipase family protein [Mycobacterium sp. shizuoka-1]|uniref:patatin-like phospholipase family protein n=1 Tax=Mycobacterium sp. shizuoka-1 TaxID=2039281 RepID=UPI000C062529|nr:patatin-like phospholipase family protein [Mycobacterium sp. shizuoka-1]GAY19156.1 patatin [Mycobacterium sp. shizuoka-1]